MGTTPDPQETNVRFIPLSYDNSDSQSSALRLVLAILPDWEHTTGSIEFVRFTDGITNTLLKIVNRRDGLSDEELDRDAVLLRAYGQGTDVIIDRARETQNHELLMQNNLAPKLLATFNNGLLYRFIRGSVTSPAELRQPNIWRAVAKRLAEWHAVVPCLPDPLAPTQHEVDGNLKPGVSLGHPENSDAASQIPIGSIVTGKPKPNIWTVMQKWVYALPTSTEEEKGRQTMLQRELLWLIGELSNRPGLGQNSLVFAHTDLLSGNIIIEPRSDESSAASKAMDTVTFIDYEYAIPSPAALDLANHFAEWPGFECDFNHIPTRAQRRDFLVHYLESYYSHLHPVSNGDTGVDGCRFTVDDLFEEVDQFRGLPGFYWGIWGLIQATISQIDFDYAAYAEIRLGEYRAWREEMDGTRVKEGKEMPLREKRWAQEH